MSNKCSINAETCPITGNTAPTGSGLFVAAGTATAENNWWGCDGFPGAPGCDTVGGTADVDPRLDLVVTADPSTISSGGTSTVTADFSNNSAGTTLNPGPVVLNGLTIDFDATNGTMNPTSDMLAALMAMSTYTNTSCPGPATVSATLDNGTEDAQIAINCATTTTTTTSTTTTTVPTTSTTVPTTTTTMPPSGFTCNGLPATHVGTTGNDTINGTEGADVIVGRQGNDTINGLGGDDVICGGNGRDTLSGNLGADNLIGGDGPDNLSGNERDDFLDGGPDSDTCKGGPGTDTAVNCESTTQVP